MGRADPGIFMGVGQDLRTRVIGQVAEGHLGEGVGGVTPPTGECASVSFYSFHMGRADPGIFMGGAKI